MIYTSLDKETTGDLTDSELCLSIGKENVGVLITFNDGRSPLKAILSFDPDVTNEVKRMEELVYTHPALLSDFRHVRILYSTRQFALIPECFDEDTTYVEDTLLPALLPDDGAPSVMVLTDVPGTGATGMSRIDKPLELFLSRTFNNPTIEHRLGVWCRTTLSSDSLGQSGKMYVHITDSHVDILVFGIRTVRLLNSWEYKDMADALYFIMCSRHVLGLDNASNELLISGNNDIVSELMPSIREYVGYVMQLPDAGTDDNPLFNEYFHELRLIEKCES